MPKFRFTITAEVTASAEVEVEAASIEEAQDIALQRSWYTNSANAKFEMDEGNDLRDVYLPDASDFEVVAEAAPSSP